jgi:NhaP-type Na+/H+ or K+/H+ antiporter
MYAEEAAHVLLVVTFFLILITVLFNGGAAAFVMKTLRLRAEDDVRSVSRQLCQSVCHALT